MHSNEHKKYLKNIKNYKIKIFILRISILIGFILLWQISASKNWINTFVFSSPLKILKQIIFLYSNNNLFHHIWVTISETLISFVLAGFFGIFIATIFWWNKTIAKTFDPYLTILNSLPKVALGPIIIIWFGAGTNSIIFMALLISLIITIINVYQGFINIDNNKIKILKTFNANKFQIYTKLIFPGSIKTIINTLKINISMCLIGVIMGEFLVSRKGIGYLILYGSQIFNLDLVISGIFILCIVASIMYYGISFIEKKLVKK